jgi:hypothetical protein
MMMENHVSIMLLYLTTHRIPADDAKRLLDDARTTDLEDF